MGQKLDVYRDMLWRTAKANQGLALIEIWTCVKCYAENMAIHTMCEVMPCSNCGHHHASKMPRYLTMCEIQADYEPDPR